MSGAKAVAFLQKKAWHTGTLQNMEKVWLAEQRALEEEKKIKLLQKELAEEREIEELRRQYEQATGKKRLERVDFLYSEPLHTGPSADDYLLGEKFVEKKQTPVLHTVVSTPGQLFPTTKLDPTSDLRAKVREDPMFLIKQKEQEARKRVQSNPIKMQRLRDEVLAEKLKKELKSSKKDKKSKSHKRSRDDSEDDSRSPKRSRSESSTTRVKEEDRRSHDRPNARQSSNARKNLHEDEFEKRDHPKFDRRDDRTDRQPDRQDYRRDDRRDDRNSYSRDDHRGDRKEDRREDRREDRYGDRRDDRRNLDRDDRRRGHEREYQRDRGHDRQESGRRDDRREPRDDKLLRTNSDSSRPQRRGLSEEEKLERIRQMQADAKERDQQRLELITKARDAESKEVDELRTRTSEESKLGATFINELSQSVYSDTSLASVEDRVKRARYTAQRGDGAWL